MKKKIPIIKLSKVILTGVLVIFCILYLFSNTTSASYESIVNSDANSTIAKWSININNENITDTYDKKIDINDITWDNSHTESGKVSPGSTGSFTFEIDPDDTDLAFRYDIKYIDKTIDDNYVLTITSITSSDSYLIHTGIDNYTGLFSLNDINNKTKKIITINISWLNNEENNEKDSLVGITDDVNYIDLDFSAKQYNGELIEEYVG